MVFPLYNESQKTRVIPSLQSELLEIRKLDCKLRMTLVLNFLRNYRLAGQVLIPKMAYNGQKLTKLVRAKITATTKPIVAIVPVIVPVKYKIPNATATIVRIIRSAFPIFAFIVLNF